MCNPMSAVIVLESRSFIALWNKSISESHEDIIEHFKLKEQNVRGEINFVRVEIIPPDYNYASPIKNWKFRLDQDLLPEWWDAKKAEAACRRELKDWRAAKIVLPGKTRKEITTGEHIAIIFGEVGVVRGHGRVSEVRDYGQVSEVRDYGKVSIVWDHGRVGTVQNYGEVGEVRNHGSVGEVRDHGRVGTVCDYGKASIVQEHGQVNVVQNKGEVDIVQHRGQVGLVRDYGQVSEVWDYGKVGVVQEHGKVNIVRNQGEVSELWDYGRVGKVRNQGTVTSYGPQVQSALCSEDAVLIDRSVSPPKCYVGPQK